MIKITQNCLECNEMWYQSVNVISLSDRVVLGCPVVIFIDCFYQTDISMGHIVAKSIL